MLVFYIALFALTFINCKFSGKDFFKEESLSREVTDSVKGVFIWLVFLSHFSSYATYSSTLDLAGQRISSLLGQLVVACFLFYSGYGVCEAIGKKGSDYIRAMPINRIAKTLLHFVLAVLLFLLVKIGLGETFSIKTVLLSFIGWESLGNSNWYIFVILALYIITWFSFMCVGKNASRAVALVTILTGALIVFLYFTRWSWWYDTALCYVFGMWFSLYKNKFLAFITKNNLAWSMCALGALIVFGILYLFPGGTIIGLTVKLMVAPIFCLVIAILLTKICISNRVLVFSGQYLFEIYILQRIPMILLKEWGLADINIYVYFVLCVIITILFSVAFRFVTNKIDQLVFKCW